MSEKNEPNPKPAPAGAPSEAAARAAKPAGTAPQPGAPGMTAVARSGLRVQAPGAAKPVFRLCAVVPVYDQPARLEGVVASLRQMGLPVVVVDDGSHEPTKSLCDRIAAPLVKVVHHAVNQGKGGAVITGFKTAAKAGYTHVLQIDADGQIDLSVVPVLVRLAQKHPSALVCGYPRFDASAPLARRFGRRLTNFWCAVNSLSISFEDAMCGLRVYPLDAALAVCENAHVGRRMDFDPEILVRLLWAGLRVKNVPVAVTYPTDGVSHFRPLGDNVRISWMHTKLFLQMATRFPIIVWSRAFGRDAVCEKPAPEEQVKTVLKPQAVQKPQKPLKPAKTPPAVDPERARRAAHAAQLAQESAAKARSAAFGAAKAAQPSESGEPGRPQRSHGGAGRGA